MSLLLQMDERAWIGLGTLFYACAFGFALFCVVRSKQHSRLLLFFLVLAGFLLQSTGLYIRGLETRSCPLGNPFEIVQFVAWSLIVIYMAVGPAFRMSLLGFFSSGLAAGLSLLSLLLPQWDATRQDNLFGGNVWIELHAALALFSYGAFAVLALTSLMYLLQNYSLKHKKLEGVFHFLPSLYELEQMNVRLLVLGIAILSASLLIGGQYWVRDTASVESGKLLATTGIWIAYLAALVLRVRETLISRSLAWTCIALFLLALLSIPTVSAPPTSADPDPAEASSARTANPRFPDARP